MAAAAPAAARNNSTGRRTILDKDRIAGKIKQARGAAQDAKGDLTGNVGDNIKGKANKLAGQVQEEFGRAKDAMRKQKNA